MADAREGLTPSAVTTGLGCGSVPEADENVGPRSALVSGMRAMYHQVRREPREGTVSDAIRVHAQACGLVAFCFDVHPDRVAEAVAVPAPVGVKPGHALVNDYWASQPTPDEKPRLDLDTFEAIKHADQFETTRSRIADWAEAWQLVDSADQLGDAAIDDLFDEIRVTLAASLESPDQ